MKVDATGIGPRRLAVCAALALVLGLAVMAGGQQNPARRLVGSYKSGEDRGPLEAVFTPTGDGTWAVDFFFSFQGQDDLSFSGSAEGTFGTGLLQGTVFNETGSRTFTFAGSFEDGTFNGTHAEIEDGVAVPTGTLTLREPPD